jgi:hypothetical protein
MMRIKNFIHNFSFLVAYFQNLFLVGLIVLDVIAIDRYLKHPQVHQGKIFFRLVC